MVRTAILVADIQRTLGAAVQQYIMDDEDVYNVSIANNNNGASKSVTLTFARATGSTDPKTIQVPPYEAQTFIGVVMKALLVSGSGANVTVVITDGGEVIRVEPQTLVVGATTSQKVDQGGVGSGGWRVTPFSQSTLNVFSGSVAAPGASGLIADTGPLGVQSELDITVEMACMDTNAVGKGMVVEHRNVANAATLKQLGGCPAPGSQHLELLRYAVASGERVRVIAGPVAGAAASLYVAAIGIVSSG